MKLFQYLWIVILFLNKITTQQDNFDSNTVFTNSEIIIAPDQYILYWNVTDENIIIKAEVKADGWVGFGLSPDGRMFNSDIIIGWSDFQGGFNSLDVHTGYLNSLKVQKL